mmetsp:Transcript_19830/g.76101  ORF Transcript_19830/g.76101 Transcript_19830/m.76101 type:complete len:297 (-) Transcript_19830:251-1141(-)
MPWRAFRDRPSGGARGHCLPRLSRPRRSFWSSKRPPHPAAAPSRTLAARGAEVRLRPCRLSRHPQRGHPLLQLQLQLQLPMPLRPQAQPLWARTLAQPPGQPTELSCTHLSCGRTWPRPGGLRAGPCPPRWLGPGWPSLSSASTAMTCPGARPTEGRRRIRRLCLRHWRRPLPWRLLARTVSPQLPWASSHPSSSSQPSRGVTGPPRQRHPRATGRQAPPLRPLHLAPPLSPCTRPQQPCTESQRGFPRPCCRPPRVLALPAAASPAPRASPSACATWTRSSAASGISPRGAPFHS